jgi:photosystem II stability/assembly factor-like uncharacterized protein
MSRVFIAGHDGTDPVLCYTDDKGSSWTTKTVDNDRKAYSLWGISRNELWLAGNPEAIGGEGEAYEPVTKFDGTSLSDDNIGEGTSGKEALGCWAVEGGVFVVVSKTGDGDLYIYDAEDDDWDSESGSVRWRDVNGVSLTEVYVVGDSVLHKWDGSSLSLVDTLSNKVLHGVSALSETEIWIAASDGVYLYDGADFTQKLAKTNAYCVHALSSNVIAAGGAGFVALSTDGGDTWTEYDSTFTGDIHGIFGRRYQEIWAVSDDGEVKRFDGSAWSADLDPGSGTAYWGVWQEVDDSPGISIVALSFEFEKKGRMKKVGPTRRA